MKKMTVNSKIRILVGLSVFTAVVLSLINYYSLKHLEGLFQEEKQLAEIIMQMRDIRTGQEHFLRAASQEAAAQSKQHIEQMEKILAREKHRNAYLKSLSSAFSEYRALFENAAELTLKLKSQLTGQENFSKQMVQEIRENIIHKVNYNRTMALMSDTDIKINEQALSDLCHEILTVIQNLKFNLAYLFLYSDAETFGAEKEIIVKQYETAFKMLTFLLPAIENAELSKTGHQIKTQLNEFKENIEQTESDWRERESLQQSLINKSREMFQIVSQLSEASAVHIAGTEKQIIQMSIVFCVCTIPLIIVLGRFIVRSAAQSLYTVIADLKINSERGFAISAEVSKASQSMSEVSAEQAASSQEVLACIEEIISVTKSNSEKTARADGFVKNCNHVIHQATVVMNDLTGAMDEISEMSGKTSDIVKTIDDIAFQTNLLALNAAIEAARAGKTGSGFAVVADEVRSLAIRATESAKHTDALIEQIVQKIKSVRSFLYDANKAFTAVNTNALETGKIVTEISASSAEQSESLEQICVSVSEIDKAVQQNAAAAEELSAASAEMNCQSQKIDGCVKAMTSIVGKNQKYQRSQKQDGNNDDDTQNESS